MHAVMALNKEDGGSRRCILVQMPEATEPDKNICKDITRERIARAIEKYEYESGFQYFSIGPSIDAESLLAGELPTYEQFAKYVFYLATGKNMEQAPTPNPTTYLVDETPTHTIHLIYQPDREALMRLALNLDIAEAICKQHPRKRKIIYAPACFLDEDYMRAKSLHFVSIPYQLFEKNITED